MSDWLQSVVQWLHGIGIHPTTDAAAAMGSAVGQAGAAVGGAVAPVVAKMDMPSLLALAAALGWASGFRLYAVVFLVGAMGYAGWIPLPAGLHILEHPAVMECAVTGVPDEERGQIVKATIVLAKGYEASDELKHELQTHVKTVTAPYKYPRKIEFVASLPKTVSGKIRRKELRDAELAAPR